MIIHLSESLSEHNRIETSHKDWQLIYRQLCFVDPALKHKLSNVSVVAKKGSKYQEITQDDFALPIVADELHIVAEVDGSKNQIFKYATMIFANMTLGLYKTSQDALTGTMRYLNRVKNDKVQGSNSFIFDQPQNVTTPGGAVPLVYGRVHTGSIVISASVSASS